MTHTPQPIGIHTASQATGTIHPNAGAAETMAPAFGWLVPVAWLAVWIPIGWGVWVTLQKASTLFN